MKHARAFTLLELLIVVTIIAVLLAVLVPTLANARNQAKKVVCASNLHTLGLATTMYLDENAGQFFRYYVNTTSSDPTGQGRLWWFGFEPNGPGSGTGRRLDKSLSPLAPYTANLDQRMQCPEFPYDDALFYPKFAQHAASYGYNLKLGLVSGPGVSRQQYLDRQQTVVAFADGIHFDFPPGFNEGHYLQYFAGASMPSGYAHFRHPRARAGEAQVVFMDGHVEGQRLSGPMYKVVVNAPAGNLAAPDGANSIYGY